MRLKAQKSLLLLGFRHKKSRSRRLIFASYGAKFGLKSFNKQLKYMKYKETLTASAPFCAPKFFSPITVY